MPERGGTAIPLLWLPIEDGAMQHLLKPILIFLVTAFVLGPVVHHLQPEESLWILAILVGIFVFLYDLVERKLKKKKEDRSKSPSND